MGEVNVSAGERASMDAHSAKVRKALADAESATAPGLFWDTDAEVQARASVAQARELFTRWVDSTSILGKRYWANAGHRGDGAPYSVADWMSHGDEIAGLATYASKQWWDAGYWTASLRSLQQSGSDVTDVVVEAGKTAGKVAKAGNELIRGIADSGARAGRTLADPWPLSAKLAAGALAAALAAYAVKRVLDLTEEVARDATQ